MRRSKSDYVIQTVVNALRLLEVFQEDEILGVTELSRRLDLHKNNVFRLLATLEEQGYVEQCDDDRYCLGTACLELGHAFSRTRSIARQARPILEDFLGLGQLHPIIDPQRLGLVAEHRAAGHPGLAGEPDHIGQVDLALGIVSSRLP